MKITFGAKRTGEERKPRGTTLFAGAGLVDSRSWPIFIGISQMIQLPDAENLRKIAKELDRT